jgi:type I site-specific restriction-modification system R (restriction) subunit
MHDHGFFQAICRVNRLDSEDKDFGYIIDYKQLFGSLTDALNKYTAGAFEGYAGEDIEGLIFLEKRYLFGADSIICKLSTEPEICWCYQVIWQS